MRILMALSLTVLRSSSSVNMLWRVKIKALNKQKWILFFVFYRFFTCTEDKSSFKIKIFEYSAALTWTVIAGIKMKQLTS